MLCPRPIATRICTDGPNPGEILMLDFRSVSDPIQNDLLEDEDNSSLPMTMTEISREEFWENVNAVPPLLRLGDPDGPGAFINSEPWNLRRCAVTGMMDNTYGVSVVLKNTEGRTQFFQHDDPITINEFKAFCNRVMPGVGVCAMGLGR
jgi:hypothetical protein